ncbi:MAG: ABC transporter substrate-binding protein [Spirochaetaceae bacterium]|jgi:iron complex transport system substrate-binding protein|nr:ABC transporter substrate-binding protein [Spirochaetaceae bacterium]
MRFFYKAVVAALILLTACSCGKKPESPSVSDQSVSDQLASAQSASEKSAPAKESSAVSVKAVDMIGREVEVPRHPQRIITDRILPFPSTYFTATHSSMKEVVAMHPASKSAAVNSMLNILAPAVSNAAANLYTGNQPNIEDVMALNPDLVFAYADEAGLIDPYIKAGITALGVRAASAAGGDALETLRGWFSVLAYTGGDETEMRAIIEEGETVKQRISAALAGYSKPKPRAVFIFSTSGGNLEIAGGNFFSEYWLKHTGADDPASQDFKGRKVVNMEQLYAWDPDILYITNFTSLMPEEVYANAIDGQDWSSLKAVRERRVYKIPLGIYRWFPPSGDAPLMFKWLAQKNHPELFIYSMEAEIKDYYQRHYGYALSDEEVSFILNPEAAAAAGYKTSY